MCKSEYVQRVTFNSYLYKTVQGNNPVSPSPSTDVHMSGQLCSTPLLPLSLSTSPCIQVIRRLTPCLTAHWKVEDLKLLVNTVGSLIRGSLSSKQDATFSNPEEVLKRI
jgi:geranylgeranyl reductase